MWKNLLPRMERKFAISEWNDGVSVWIWCENVQNYAGKVFLIQKTTLLFWPHIFNILNFSWENLPTRMERKFAISESNDGVSVWIWCEDILNMTFFPPSKIAGKIYLIHKTTWLFCPHIFNILNLRGKISHYGWKKNLPSLRGMVVNCVDMMWKHSQHDFFPPFFESAWENVLDPQDTWLFCPHIFNMLNFCGKISHHGWKENLRSLSGMIRWLWRYDVKTSSAWFFPSLFSKLHRKVFLIQKTTLLFWPHIFNILNLRGKISHHGWKENLPSQSGMMGWVCVYDMKTISTWLFPPFF